MSWPLIGREAQLAYELLRSGKVVALLGVAGVGESRLLKELLDRAEDYAIAVFRPLATESTRTDE